MTQKTEGLPKNKVYIYAAAVVIVALVGAVVYLVNERNQEAQQAVQPRNGYEYEDNATVGDMPGVDREEMLAMLQENADQSAIAFTVNGTPTVVNYTMNLLFENPVGNGKDVSVRIQDGESEDIIYESKIIQEGSYISNVTINKEYLPGQYEATAYITAFDTETHAQIGEVAAGLTIDVIEPPAP